MFNFFNFNHFSNKLVWENVPQWYISHPPGGYDKVFHTDRASVERYDPETQEWSFIAEMENPRSGLVLVCVDHFLYAIGGRSRYHQYFDIGER